MRGQRKCEKYSEADDIEDEAHLYERGERHTKDGKEVLSRRISITYTCYSILQNVAKKAPRFNGGMN